MRKGLKLKKIVMVTVDRAGQEPQTVPIEQYIAAAGKKAAAIARKLAVGASAEVPGSGGTKYRITISQQTSGRHGGRRGLRKGAHVKGGAARHSRRKGRYARTHVPVAEHAAATRSLEQQYQDAKGEYHQLGEALREAHSVEQIAEAKK